ncbi:suppressor protein SRP40-like isoform X1 [Phoenix dactylifera]|uniref:Suppressor protein SRP40-like isoform X1 n=1 Tax=Phoenix dactylifera TaxID=42345 RepID=A0A8B7C9K7_PHODC|nr:suppressor protein SRP40-like isoform X1 [Phoenix dactylifera]
MRENPKRLNTSTPFLFIPRQIMLESHTGVVAQEEGKERRKDTEAKKEKKRKKRRSSETLEGGPGGSETLDLDRASKGGGAPLKGKGKEILLQSIAAFLESNGFLKTLSAFRSEAQLEFLVQMDGWKSSILNLEDLFSKCLEPSKGHAEASIEWLKEQDSEKVGISTEAQRKDIYNDVSEHTHKKKRKKSDDIDNSTNTELSKPGLPNGSDGVVNTVEKISNKLVDELQVKSKKKTKRSASEDCSVENTEVSQEKTLKESTSVDDKTDLEKLKSVEGSYVETKDKKKKKKLVSDSLGENAEKNQLEVSHGTVENSVHENQLPQPHENEKEKRKKKHKVVSDSCNEKSEPSDYGKLQEAVRDKIEELKSLTKNSESTAKHKDEKKKKTKEISDSLAQNIEQSELEASQNVINKKSKDFKSTVYENNTDSELLYSVTMHPSVKESLDNKDSEYKEKKKRKGKSTSESAISFDQADGGTSHKDLRKSDVKKENVPLSEDNVIKNEKKISKKRKRLASEEKEALVDNDIAGKASKIKPAVTEDNKETGSLEKSNKSLTQYENPVPAKKRKTEENNENTKPLREQFDGNLSTCDYQKEVVGHQVANGNGEKKEREGGNSAKAIKKEKSSAEPQTVNSFRRVKADDVQFADKRLQDNSYWAKAGADDGYGAKAQEILGQVRGRDFRHEKTKKKRGTYKGGQIDLQSYSIKFNYSDEE